MSRYVLEWTAVDTGEQRCVEVPLEGVLHLGRAVTNEVVITGDTAISRVHATLNVDDGEFVLRCEPTAKNPVICEGDEYREVTLQVGANFQIGATQFLCGMVEDTPESLDDLEIASETPAAEERIRETTYAPDALLNTEFGNASQQIEILANLPAIIAATPTDEELAVKVTELLLHGIPQAEAVAAVYYADDDLSWSELDRGEAPKPALMRVATRDTFTGRFRPSRRMMLKSLRLEESVMHIWEGEATSLQFTASEGLGWAFAVPLRGDACRGWCLYVSGKGSRQGNMFVNEDALQGDLRFAELMSQFIGSVRQVRSLQQQRTQLSAFFSPKVIESLTASNAPQHGLIPAERDVTVLFCDLRGFSKRSEA